MKLRIPLSLLICTILLSDASGQEGSWYIELGAGPALGHSTLSQEGFNFDTTCYPGFVCENISQRRGYRWFYTIPTDPGFAFRVGIGREQGRLRIDLNAQYSSRNLEQNFDRVTLLDGSPAPEFQDISGYKITVNTGIGALQVFSFRINTFMDLLPKDRTLHPYLGIGTGVSRATITDFYYEERYICEGICFLADPSSYDVLQDEELEDIILITEGHAGLEYALASKFLVGIRFSYALFQSFSSEAEYLEHRVENLTNTNTFSKLNLMTAMATVRYRL